MSAVVQEPDTLQLLTLPYTHTQVELLDSSAFRKLAGEWGYRLTLEQLERLNTLNLLVPFYRIDDEELTDLAVEPGPGDFSTLARAARLGRVRDPMLEDRSIRWPHTRPPDASPNWFDGFHYSQWQLLSLRSALRAMNNFDILADRREYAATAEADLDRETKRAANERHELMAISALSLRYFPSVVHRIRWDVRIDRADLQQSRYEYDASTRLDVAAYPPDNLADTAQWMLQIAGSDDPMSNWWPLLRHSDSNGWFQMRGAPLESVWRRIGAEMLLRAHEELEKGGMLGPLEDPSTWSTHHPFLDRVGLQPNTPGLERALATFGLSPHPRVVLVLEGKVEVLHMRALLDAVGTFAHVVKVFEMGTSSDSPHQLARFLAPRLGDVRGDRQLLDSMPAALVVAMDPEGYWDAKRRDASIATLKRKVQEEVEVQGGALNDDELDMLVQVRVWGEDSYEIANFSDGELIEALLTVCAAGERTPEMEEKLAAAVAHARTGHYDIGIVFERMGWPTQKVLLAKELIPVLLAKLDQAAEGAPPVPVVDLLTLVRELAGRFSGGGFSIDANTAGG